MLSGLLLLAASLFASGLMAQERGFTSDSIVFYGNDTLRYGATLTLPNNQKKSVAVIIASGSYPQDRDGMMAGKPIYKQMAEYLSNRGIAVLRVDDRGVGKSNGVYEKATTADFANDIIASVNYLKTRKDIRHNRIGILGHSEGGASMSIAASKCKDIRFLISAAGLMSPGLESVIQQNIDIVHTTEGLPEYDMKRYDEINNIMFHTAYKYADADSTTLSSRLYEEYYKWQKKDSVYFKTLGIEFDHFRWSIYMYTLQANTPWYRFFIRYNPQDYLSKVKVPFLAVNGDKDVMVNYKENLGNVKKFLAHNKDVSIVVIKNMNHLFLPCQKGTQAEYHSIKAGISQEAMETIYRWIKKRFL